MRNIEISAKTVDEAVELALKELKLKKEEAKVEILEQPNKGFFGILGNKNALVRVEEIFDPVKEVKKFLENIFTSFGINPDMQVEKKDDYIIFNITGKDLGILIGRRGDTLDSIQFLVNLVVNKEKEDRVKIIIDVEGYRKRREETLVNLGKRLAQKVKRTGHKVVLEPMNPQERRIIHLTLQDDKMIRTYSEGEEPYRKVVIVPKN